ncbi:DUF2332 domain-containing protein [Agrobacterium genomosp. 13]|uniref:DUF2332 domain-containing protein n=1 Tax=Agrobacterium genomosp. 13 str. CFBP 6927 TaxID=1183428 RepID=A0ABM9VIP4_9HYPH|nr:DUF2332 domain-containing protein [Agrobacterium genomosp. 13]CUX45546.1 conserved hypothetical protein [Agrobacterium genomosp. 13 str. CFBP 6927]
MHDEAVRNAFLVQARACDNLGSPFTARLCRAVAARLDRQTEVGEKILSWPGDVGPSGDSVPLRLAGALHALVLEDKIGPLVDIAPENEDALWRACADALRFHSAFILERLKSPPQTNEVRRSAVLLPAFLSIAGLTGKPLALSEVGASAGLNLQFDRYQYRLGDLAWGRQSAVFMSPEWRGNTPPDAQIDIIERAGCDLNPLDPSSAEDRSRLISYLWADQTDRLERTAAALRIAEENGLHVEKADAIDWLKRRLATDHPGATHVVYHSVAWQYFPEILKQAGEALIVEAGARATPDAPLARLQMEADATPGSAAITLQIWPTGEKQEIGRADFHGRWVEWRGWEAEKQRF